MRRAKLDEKLKCLNEAGIPAELGHEPPNDLSVSSHFNISSVLW